MTVFPDGAALAHNVDLLWLPAAWFAVHRHQRWAACAFTLVCLLTLRTQVELMDSTDHGSGFMNLLHAPAYVRGAIAYSLVILLYLVLAHFSPKAGNTVILAASLTIYIFAFCFTMVLMLL